MLRHQENGASRRISIAVTTGRIVASARSPVYGGAAGHEEIGVILPCNGQ